MYDLVARALGRRRRPVLATVAVSPVSTNLGGRCRLGCIDLRDRDRTKVA